MKNIYTFCNFSSDFAPSNALQIVNNLLIIYLEMPKIQAAAPKLKIWLLLEIIDMGGSKMTKYEKISLAISIALLILSLLSYLKM